MKLYVIYLCNYLFRYAITDLGYLSYVFIIDCCYSFNVYSFNQSGFLSYIYSSWFVLSFLIRLLFKPPMYYPSLHRFIHLKTVSDVLCSHLIPRVLFRAFGFILFSFCSQRWKKVLKYVWSLLFVSSKPVKKNKHLLAGPWCTLGPDKTTDDLS